MKSVVQKKFISEYQNRITMISSSQRKHFVFFAPVIFSPLENRYIVLTRGKEPSIELAEVFGAEVREVYPCMAADCSWYICDGIS